jgi:hypothetical protein
MIDPRRQKPSGRRMGAQHSGWHVRLDFVKMFEKIFHRKPKDEPAKTVEGYHEVDTQSARKED